MQSDCCLEFSWHSRPSGPYSERFREASHSLHLSHGWNSMVSSFDLWILWRSRNIMKHLVPLWGVKEKQHEKHIPQRAGPLWWRYRWFVLRNTSSLPATCSKRVSRWPHQASWISDPQRFQHLEAANLLLVESLVRCYAMAMPWLDDPPQFDADDYWRWKIMKQKLEFVIVQVPYGATWCPIWCVGDGTNMDWTNGTNTWFCGSPIHFLPMPDWWPALRFDFPWALFHSASDSYAAGRRLWAGLSDGFQEDMVKVW